MSRSSSRWDFHFHSYVLTIYVRLYCILELVVFYSLVRRGHIHKVSVQLVPKYFSRDCITDSISCSERKNRKKTRLKQDSKSIKEDQNVVVVANPPGSSSLRCRTAISTLSLYCRSAAAPLLHQYCSAVAPPLSLRCRAAVAPLSHRYCSTVAPLLSLLLSLRSCTAIAPLSRHYRSAAVAPLMSLLLSLCNHTVIAPLSRRCRTAAVAPAVATQSHRYQTAIATVSRHCCSAAVLFYI